MLIRRALHGAFFCAATSWVACGAGGAPSSLTPTPTAESRSRPLVDHVGPGADWIAFLSPRAILGQAPLAAVVSAIIPAERFERFARDNEVDLRTLDELIVASVNSYPLVLARGAHVDAPYAIDMMGMRLAPIESAAEEPFVRRAGFLAQERYAIAALDPHTVAMARGLSASLEGTLACGEPSETCGIPDRDQALLAAHQTDASLLIRGGWSLPFDSPLSQTLSRLERSLVTVRVDPRSKLIVYIRLEGAIAEEDASRLLRVARALMTSDLGAALGMADAVDSLRIDPTEGGISVLAELDAAALAQGLRVLFMAPMSEILESL